MPKIFLFLIKPCRTFFYFSLSRDQHFSISHIFYFNIFLFFFYFYFIANNSITLISHIRRRSIFHFFITSEKSQFMVFVFLSGKHRTFLFCSGKANLISLFSSVENQNETFLFSHFCLSLIEIMTKCYDFS